MENQENSINYIEFPMIDPQATKAFYSSVFAWEFTKWGADYLSFTGATVEGGFNREDGHKPERPGILVILYTHNLEQKRDEIITHDGVIVRDIYSFPGGRRFHFHDPNGNELAVWSEKPPAVAQG